MMTWSRLLVISTLPFALAIGAFVVGCGGAEGQLDQSMKEHEDELLSTNGLPTNGLPTNGLPANGLPTNGLSALGLSQSSFANWFHWFQGCGTADGCSPSNPGAGSTGSGTPTSRAFADKIMHYLVQCACGPNETLTFTDRAGGTHSW